MIFRLMRWASALGLAALALWLLWDDLAAAWERLTCGPVAVDGVPKPVPME